MIKAENLFIKVVWTLVALVSLSFVFFLIANTITTFLKYDVFTQTKRISANSSILPSITFCAFENQSVDFKYFFLEANFKNFNGSTVHLTGEEFYYQYDQNNQKCLTINHYDNKSSQEFLATKYYLTQESFYFKVNLSTKFSYVDVYLSDNYLNALDWTQLATTFGNLNKGWIDIKTTKVVEHQVGEPYNKCEDISDITYRKLNCLDQCKNRQFVSTYNCTLRNYYSLLDYRFCNFKSNQSEENVLSYKFDSVCDQECPKECGSTKFDERVDNFE